MDVRRFDRSTLSIHAVDPVPPAAPSTGSRRVLDCPSARATMAETISHAGSEWRLTRLPSALDASRATNRIRPWLSRSEEEQRQRERVARVRRENGIPAPEEWMW